MNSVPEPAAHPAAVADEFGRRWYSAAAVETHIVLAAADPAALSEPGGRDWFVTTNAARLAVRVAAAMRGQMVAEWRVPMASAAATYEALDAVDADGYRALLETVADSVLTDGDATAAYIAGLEAIEPRIRAGAAAILRRALDG